MNLKSATALFVSLLSLGVSAWSAYKTDQNTKLAYRPYVSAMPTFDDSGKKHGIYLSNAGLGPATINTMKLEVDGRVYSGLGESIWPQFLKDIKLTPTCYRTGWPVSRTVLRVGEDDPLLVLTDNASLPCQIELAKLLAEENIVITIGYSSMFGQAYTSRGTASMQDANLRELERAWHMLMGR